MNTVKQTVHSKGNLSSTFLPYNTVQNTNRICQVATDNSLMSQFVNNDNQLMTNFDNNLVFSHTPKQIFTSDFQSLPEKYYNKLSDTFIETSRNQGSSSSFVPHTIQMEHSTSLQKLSNTDCIPSYCDYSMEMFNPNYSSINFFNDFKDNYEHKDQQNRSCNGSYSLTDTSKCQLDPIISVKGLSDNSNTSNHKNQFTASNICCNPQMNNFHVSQRNYPTNISTFKPVSKDFSYTLSAAHKDFNYSISIIPENDSLKCTLKEPNNSNTNSCYFESNCTLSLQGKKNKDWKDSLPPVLFEMNSNFNENEQIQPTTYHHVKSPDLYSTDYLTNFSYSQIGNHSMLDNNEVVKSKIQLSEAQPMGFSRYRNDDDIFCQNSEINYMKYEEKHSIPVSSQQQKTYPNSYNTTFNLKNNSSFRPLQRSPAVVGVSDLLIKSDAELNSILEKIKSVSNSNHPKLESHELLKQKCSFDSSPDKSTSNGGLSSNPYQDDVSPARRRFFPHYLTHDVKLNYSTGISHQDSDDMEEEKRSFYDYGCDDEEDEDKMEDEDELYLCNDNMDKGNQKFHTNYSLFNSKYSTHNKNAYNNNASVIQRIRELELQNQVYHWEDNCIHSTDKSCSKGTTRNINNNIKNSSNNKNTNNKNFSTINEVENEDDEDERKMLSTYECEDNDMPFIDSDSFILEFSHLKGLLPRIADLEEITLSSIELHLSLFYGQFMQSTNKLNKSQKFPQYHCHQECSSGDPKIRNVQIKHCFDTTQHYDQEIYVK
ncbi:unnamed protein product [Heterobilharzia americana]|nr:unnamed protein product [Heterobilharzia americana]